MQKLGWVREITDGPEREQQLAADYLQAVSQKKRGKPVTALVISPSLAPGTFLVGAFGESAILFDRQTMTIDISYENEDDFVKNLATIRAELRSALAIPVPAGLVTGTVTGGTVTASHGHPSGVPVKAK